MSPRARRRWLSGTLLLLAIACAVTAGLAGAASSSHDGNRSSAASRPAVTPSRPAARTASRRPNIVFVLTDDLSEDLVRYMPQVQALEGRGISFNNYFVADSLCCPSRSSIFTGNFPHDTGVFQNVGPDGGIGAFYAHDDEQSTFNVALHNAGYRTAMMGKYLNGYLQGPTRSPVPSTYVPPGWDQWDVGGFDYSEYNYELNQDGKLHHYGHKARDYLTDVLTRKGVRFINNSARSGRPFLLELSTFAPHSPYTPAPRYAHDFPGLTAPRPPSFDVLPSNPPRWLAGHLPLTKGKIARINRAFRRRVQAVQAVDDMLAKVQAALAARGQLRNTYIVFSSDNGLHTGEYRLMPGKLTAFDTDIHVPLVIAGPGIPAGATTDSMSENVDLAKTFAAFGGTSLPSDGHSLVPLLKGASPADWRDAVLIEHHGPDLSVDDPDEQSAPSGNPTTYEAMRTPGFLYVEYRDGEREYYDLDNDPDELHNIAGSLSSDQLARLHDELAGLENCHNGNSCWAAGHVDGSS